MLHNISKMKNIYNKLTYITNGSNKIEALNQDMFGSLIGFTNNTPIRMPTESPLKYIRIMHTTLEQFLSYIGKTNGGKNLTTEHCLFKNDVFWKNYYKNTVIRSESILHTMIHHTKRTLSYIADLYQPNTRKEYSSTYQEIISDILSHARHTDVKLLEIGLTKNNALIWKDYFNEHIHITGVESECSDCSGFSGFSGYSNVTILQGAQNNVEHFQGNSYDLIIDNGVKSLTSKQVRFTYVWPYVASKGYYIIENVQYLVERSANSIFEDLKDREDIESIELYPSQIQTIDGNDRYCLVSIKKK